MIRRLIGLAFVSAAIVASGVALSRGARALIEAAAAGPDRAVPTTEVRRGPVTITVRARGEIQGGGAETLTTPMTGAAELAIIELRQPGERVEPGDVVVRFDTSQQEYDIREAEADLAEAEQQVVQAEAEARAALEEARFQVRAAELDLEIARQELRRNAVLPAIEQRRNEIALERAENAYRQAAADLASREASSEAGIDIHRAAAREAARAAEAARQAIENMTLVAHTAGYVQILDNRNGQNIFFIGMTLPQFQIGDAARPGQPVAQIPNLDRWEVSARIPEADRGYLEIGQPAAVIPAAVPGRRLEGRVAVLGGATGNAWERAFDIRIALDESDPGLRPGVSADVEVTVAALDDVLWIPAQALFERDGREFVFVESPEGFITREVTLVRRSESQAVITGIEEGAVVALARPGQSAAPAGEAPAGALEALPQ